MKLMENELKETFDEDESFLSFLPHIRTLKNENARVRIFAYEHEQRPLNSKRINSSKFQTQQFTEVETANSTYSNPVSVSSHLNNFSDESLHDHHEYKLH